MSDPRGYPRPDRRRRYGVSFGRAVLYTVVGTILPGAGMIAAGRRRIGALILGLTVAGLAVLAWIAVRSPRLFLHLAVEPARLGTVAVGLAIVALAWVVVIVSSHRMLRPVDASAGQRVVGSGLVCVLALVVMLPLLVASRYAMVQRDLVSHVFASDTSKSETRPKHVDPKKPNPWGKRPRVNVMLLGGDSGPGRVGTRPDTVIVASIDIRSGNTVLFSLPRNLERVPFPPGSKLASLYPEGRFEGPGNPLEWMLNAMYRNVPAQHPGLIKSDNPGADVMKLAVGQALGLRLDYFVLINLRGFQELINALGGVTMNVNERVPIGGNTDEGIPPKHWIHPGPHRHLDGFHALWYARGRWGSDDYHRMNRQRCVVKAIIDQAQPAQVLQRYEAIAQSSRDIVQTDIPQSLLAAFVDLSLKVKAASVTSVVFDNTVINPADPDYVLMRSKVRRAVRASEHLPTTAEGAGSHGSTPKPSPTRTHRPHRTGGADNLRSSCAYHPQAQ